MVGAPAVEGDVQQPAPRVSLAGKDLVSLRRADEMGDAITARGGSGQISASPSRPKGADYIALAVVFALSALAFYVENFTALSTAS